LEEESPGLLLFILLERPFRGVVIFVPEAFVVVVVFSLERPSREADKAPDMVNALLLWRCLVVLVVVLFVAVSAVGTDP
jgi:hypothetical protein